MKQLYPGTRFHYDHFFVDNPLKLEKMELAQIGEICLEPGSIVDAHDQMCHEISYIISGAGYFEMNGVRIEVAAGDVVVTPAQGVHTIYAAEHTSLYYAYAGFRMNENGVECGLYDEAVWGQSEHKKARAHSELYGHFRRCMDEFYRSSQVNMLMAEACLIQMITWTARSMRPFDDVADYENIADNLGELVYHIMKYVEVNIYHPLTVSGIADSLGYSAYYISHIFKEKTDKTLQDYIGEAKINKARELIALKRFTMTEIAAKLGYSNLPSFSRAFKRRMGCYPSDFT